MGPSFSLRSEYFYGPFSLNFSGAAFVNIYVKHKTMGNFGSLGSGILNANTKCSLRGKRFSPVCFNWPERVWEGHIAPVPLFPPFNPYSRLGSKQFLDVTGWKDQQCLSITTAEEAQQLGKTDLKISVLLCVPCPCLSHFFILTRHDNNETKQNKMKKKKKMSICMKT